MVSAKFWLFYSVFSVLNFHQTAATIMPMPWYLGRWWISELSCNIRISSKVHFKLKYIQISFDHDFCLSCEIILESCTEHGSITAMLCAKFQNDFTTQMDGMHKTDIAKLYLTEFWTNCFFCHGPLDVLFSVSCCVYTGSICGGLQGISAPSSIWRDWKLNWWDKI